MCSPISKSLACCLPQFSLDIVSVILSFVAFDVAREGREPRLLSSFSGLSRDQTRMGVNDTDGHVWIVGERGLCVYGADPPTLVLARSVSEFDRPCRGVAFCRGKAYTIYEGLFEGKFYRGPLHHVSEQEWNDFSTIHPRSATQPQTTFPSLCVFDSRGQLQRSFCLRMFMPRAVAVDDEYIYVVCATSGRFHVIDHNGLCIRAIGSKEGTTSGNKRVQVGASTSLGIALHPDGRIFTTNADAETVEVLFLVFHICQTSRIIHF